MRAALRPFKALARMRDRRQRQLPGRRASGHRGMGGEKQRDAAAAVVKIGAERHELRDLGISQPVEPDPGRGRTLADGVMRRAPRRSCRLPPGSSPCAAQSPRRCARRGFVLARLGRVAGARNRGRVLPDDLDLPGDLLLIEVADTGARASKPGRCLGRNRDAVCIADLVAVARRHEMRDIQRQQRRAFGALQRPEWIGRLSPNPPAWPGSRPARTR